jgi:hypothetical protein
MSKSEPTMTDMTDRDRAHAVAHAWEALRAHLALRSRRLNDEVSGYPTPIARCDEQLPKLLAERAQAVRELRRANEAAAAADGVARVRAYAQFLAASEQSDDDAAGEVLRRRLAQALSRAAVGAEPAAGT